MKVLCKLGTLSIKRNETFLVILCLYCVYLEQLDEMAAAYPDRLKLWYTLDRPGEGWEYDKVRYRNDPLNPSRISI